MSPFKSSSSLFNAFPSPFGASLSDYYAYFYFNTSTSPRIIAQPSLINTFVVFYVYSQQFNVSLLQNNVFLSPLNTSQLKINASQLPCNASLFHFNTSPSPFRTSPSNHRKYDSVARSRRPLTPLHRPSIPLHRALMLFCHPFTSSTFITYNYCISVTY